MRLQETQVKNYLYEAFSILKEKNIELLNFSYSISLKQIKQESGFETSARSAVGALGLAQAMPATFEEIKNKLKNKGVQIYDPLNPLDAMIFYLFYQYNEIPRLLKYFKIPITAENMLRAYNAGFNTKVWIKSKENNDYIKRILGNNLSILLLFIINFI